MGNGSSSDSSSGWELEDGQGPSLCKNKRPLSSVEPEEGGEETQFNMFQYDPSLNGTLQKRSARLCRNGEKPVACRLPVKSYYCASCFKQSRHDDQETVEWVGCKYCRQWFHKGRERARRNVPAHEHCCHMQELVEKRKRNKLWIRHAAESQRKEGIISLKSNQIMVNGSFLRSAHAIGDLDILVLDSPCVPPPNGPPLKCFEVHMHWDFGYFKRLKRQVDIPDLLNKWIDHVQPWREFRVFLYSSSKITKEDLIALFSRKWGDVCLAVNMKKLGMPVDHIGDVVDSIPLATREFSLSVQADKMLCIAPIESQFTKRIQHFIDTKGDYEAEVHIGADFLCIDTSKIRLNLDINFPEFCIAEDGCDEYEIRVGHAQSGRYISLEYEDEDLDDLCAIRLCVSLCLCKPTLEQTVCRHGFFWCNDELEKKLRRLGI